MLDAYKKHVRVAISFVVVVAAYCVYSLAAVPFIEPEDTVSEQGVVTEEEREQALAGVARQRADLKRWFKEGDWELTSPKILETNQAKLLLREYHPNKEDPHEVTLIPCTMIFFPDGTFEDEEERLRRATVMRSPAGARLRFAEPIDLKKGQVGSKIVGGELLGKVTIHSGQRLPGPEDDLLLFAERVTMKDDVVTTPYLVEFFQGANQGRGRDMRLTLTSDVEKLADPTLPSAKSFELARDVYMRMESADGDILLGGPQPAQLVAPAEAAAAKPKPPVEITCRGSFKFDMRSYVATFHEQVNVVRLNAVGPSDTLTCEKLALRFEPDPTAADAAGAKPKGGVPKLRPKLIIADGNPVLLESPSNAVDARGRRLEYDVQTRSGKLFDNEEAMLRQDDPVSHQFREIHARELEFESDPTSPNGPPRRVDARGKGWLRGSPPANPEQQIFVRWTSRMTFYPYQGNQVLSIRGAAHVQAAGTGALDADEIHVWLRRSADGSPTAALAGGATGGFVPEKMTAIGHVVPDTPQLHGLIGQLNIWFERDPPAPVVAGPAAAVAPAPEPEKEKPAEQAPPSQRWHVSGDLVKALILLRPAGGKSEVKQLTLDGHARCAELPMPVRPDRPLPEKPEQLLEMTGEQFHLEQPTPLEATVRITGRPARVMARGMTLIGGAEGQPGNIHLHRSTNRLWIPGPGRLELPVAEDMQGRKLQRSQMLNIVWQGRMDFDGSEAHFQTTDKTQKEVVASTDESTLITPDMRVVFNEPVRFDGTGSGRRPQVERLFCRRGVQLDRRERQAGKWTSWERLTARDLTYHYTSGDLEADGPGVITRTWLDSGDSAMSLPNGRKKPPPAPRKPPVANAPKGPRLVYLNATFDDKLTGNQKRETVTLHRRVKSVYGPVRNWEARIDPNYPERLGTEGFVIRCDELQLDKTGVTRDNQPTMELKGTGNTLIEGSDFSARCGEVQYASSKDLLTLLGDGRAPATFYRNQRLGSNPLDFSAGRILYYPKTQKLSVENFESLDMQNLPSKKPEGKAPPR